MSKFTSEEKLTAIVAFLFFFDGVGLVLWIESVLRLTQTPYYFIDHFLFGLFFPFLWLSFGGNQLGIRIGITVTALMHIPYELWEAWRGHPTPGQLAAGVVGMLFAWGIYRTWTWWRLQVAAERA